MASAQVVPLDDIQGDWTSRCRIRLDELSGHDQRGVLWGLRYADDRPTSAMILDAQDLDPLDAAANATVAGAAVVRHANLGTNWTPVLGTNIGGTDFLTHTGTYQAIARVYTVSAVPPQLRFVYDVGDLTLPVENLACTIPLDHNFYLADLGQIRLDQVPVGDHRWAGQIQGKGAAGGESLSIHQLYFVPLDEGAGKLAAPSVTVEGLNDNLVRDEFNQTAGALTGKTLPIGGAWTVVSGSDTDDLTVDATNHVATRTALSDSGTLGGRYVDAGAIDYPGALLWQADVLLDYTTRPANINTRGIYARRSATGIVKVALVPWTTPANSTLVQLSVLDGLLGVSYAFAQTVVPEMKGQWQTLRLLVTDGHAWLWVFPQGSSPGTPISVASDQLASGGGVTTGKIGYYDSWGSGVSGDTRKLDNVAAYSPTLDAVLFANQSAELRTDGMYRTASDGNASGPVSGVTGDLPRLPPAGLEGRPAELFILTSRGDLDQLPDSGDGDQFGLSVSHNPSWLYAPAA